MAASSSKKHFAAFVVHRGPRSKDLALDIKQMLEIEGISTFVDEMDLRCGQHAPTVMKQTLLAAKAAIVLFTPDFYDSSSCVQELEYVLEQHTKCQSYIPVYVSRTYEEVYMDARQHYGKRFAEEVTRITAIRHKAECRNSPDWAATAKAICKAITEVPGIRDPPSADTTNIKLEGKSSWQQLLQEFKTLENQASAAAQEMSEPPPVWILSHTDTVHFAVQLREVLKSQKIGAETYEQSADSLGGVTDRAAALLKAQVAIIVYCGCIFDVVCCQHLVHLCAEYQRPCIAVYYKVGEHDMRVRAVDAAGLNFAKQIFAGNIMVKHKGIMDSSGLTFKLEADTQQEVYNAVMKIVNRQPMLAAQSLKSTQAVTAAMEAPAVAPVSGAVSAGSPVLNAVPAAGAATTPMQCFGPLPGTAPAATHALGLAPPATAAVPTSGAATWSSTGPNSPLDLWSQVQVAPAIWQQMLQLQQQLNMLQLAQHGTHPLSVPPSPIVSGGQFISTMPCLADGQSWPPEAACMAQVTAGIRSATGHGSILTVGELPAGFIGGPVYLYNCVRSWAKAAAMAGGLGAATTRIFAASAGGGMVAWCQQGWGVFLPPGASDLPHMYCSQRILAADHNSKGVRLPLQLQWGCGASGASTSTSSSGRRLSSRPHQPHIVIKGGLRLHTLQLTHGAGAVVELPPELLYFEELLLVTATGDGSYFHSDSVPLLVLEADIDVITELNTMVATYTDIPIVEGLYHILLQPGHQLAVWAAQSAATELESQQAIAASRATAAYGLLVLTIEQNAVSTASWLLTRLSALGRAAPPSGSSTLSALVMQQQRAWAAGNHQEVLLLLAAAQGGSMQKLFQEWSAQQNLPTDMPDQADVPDLLQRAIEDIQQTIAAAAATRAALAVDEWSKLAYRPGLLQADSLQDVEAVLGPAGDLAAAVMAGSDTSNLKRLLEAGSHSTQELIDAVDLAVLLEPSHSTDTVLLLQQRMQQLLSFEQASVTAQAKSRTKNPSSDRGNCRGQFAVPSWCMGCLGDSAGVLGWFADAVPQRAGAKARATQQPGVGGLLQHLQMVEPRLFQLLPAYRRLKLLGGGSYTTVILAHNTLTGAPVAIKQVPRYLEPGFLQKIAEKECLNLRLMMTHPHIVKFYEVFLTHRHVNIVLEYADGGSLFTYVQSRNRLREPLARWFFQQLIIAVDYCHNKGVANRDIKLENCLLKAVPGLPRPLLKLCDLGLSTTANNSAGSQGGTLVYMAPEVVFAKSSGVYKPKLVDLWSCGVLLYTMLVGRYPYKFEKEDKNGGTSRIWPTAYEWYLKDEHQHDKWMQCVGLSHDCIDLIRRLLQPLPKQRINMQGIVQHSWFLQDLPPGALDMNDRYLAQHTQHFQLEEEIKRVIAAAADETVEAHDTLISASQEPEGTGLRPLERCMSIPTEQLCQGDLLGRGAFGLVYRGSWLALPVAIKVPTAGIRLGDQQDPAKDMLVHEAGQLERLSHPNVVDLLGMCCDPPQLVLELAKGDAAQTLKQGHVAWEHRLCILLDVASALTYIHTNGFVHGDVRATNVLMFESGVAKLCDFGLSERLSESETVTSAIGDRHPFWAAPELLEKSCMSKASDVYAFGTLMYEVLTGNSPFGLLSKEQQACKLMDMRAKTLLSYSEELLMDIRPGTAHNRKALDDYTKLMLQCWAVEVDQRPGVQHIHHQLSSWHSQVLVELAAAASQKAAAATTGHEEAEQQAVEAQQKAIMVQVPPLADAMVPHVLAGGIDNQLRQWSTVVSFPSIVLDVAS